MLDKINKTRKFTINIDTTINKILSLHKLAVEYEGHIMLNKVELSEIDIQYSYAKILLNLLLYLNSKLSIGLNVLSIADLVNLLLNSLRIA